MGLSNCFNTSAAIDRICNLDWENFNEDQMASAVWMFYYRSVQFRENLEAALRLHPNDPDLEKLVSEELHTNNLSPFPGIAEEGEFLGHDDFLKRIMDSYPMPREKKQFLNHLGDKYLTELSVMSDELKAMCLVSSEDGGSRKIYQNVMKSPEECWTSDEMKAFKHFLQKHIEFDSDEGENHGHGDLVRKIGITDDVSSMLETFADCLEEAINYNNKPEL